MSVQLYKRDSLKVAIVVLLILNAFIVLSASSPDIKPNPGHSFDEVFLGPIKIVDAFVGIGTSSPSSELDVNGKIVMQSQTEASDSDETVATKAYVDNNGGGPIFISPKTFTTPNGQWTTINIQNELGLDKAPSAIIIEQKWTAGQSPNSNSKFRALGREYQAISIHAGGSGDIESNSFQGTFPVNSDGTIDFYAVYQGDALPLNFKLIAYYR